MDRPWTQNWCGGTWREIKRVDIYNAANVNNAKQGWTMEPFTAEYQEKFYRPTDRIKLQADD